jgi:hypothetical protein
MRRVLLSFLFAPLAGCAVLPIPYQEPASGPVATVQLKNDSNQLLTISLFQTSRACVGRRKVAEIAPFAEAGRTIPADIEVTLQYRLLQRGMNAFCLANLRFTPRRDRRYVLNTSEGPHGCKWEMADVTDPANPAPVPLQTIKPTTGWTEDSSFCKE